MKRAREQQIVKVMINLYYRKHHHEVISEMEILDYVNSRLDKCVFKDQKGFCSGCPIHCYNKVMREHIRKVMRYSGPRMLFRHPLLTLAHLKGKSWKNVDTSKYKTKTTS